MLIPPGSGRRDIKGHGVGRRGTAIVWTCVVSPGLRWQTQAPIAWTHVGRGQGRHPARLNTPGRGRTTCLEGAKVAPGLSPSLYRAGTEDQRGAGPRAGSHSEAVGEAGLESESLGSGAISVHFAPPFLFSSLPPPHPPSLLLSCFLLDALAAPETPSSLSKTMFQSDQGRQTQISAYRRRPENTAGRRHSKFKVVSPIRRVYRPRGPLS